MQALDTAAETTVMVVQTAGVPGKELVSDLEMRGWHVWERTPADVVEGRAGSYPPDVVVLYADPAGAEPALVLRSIDELFGAVPVLVVTDDPELAKSLLQSGASVTMPSTAAPELIALQARALQRLALSARYATDPAGVLRVRSLKVDTLRCEVWAGNKRIDLTPTEYRILHTLARHPGRALSSDYLLQQSTGSELPMPGAREIVKVHIARLRRKLREATGESDFIRNVRNVGYLLERRRRGARRG